MREVRESIRLMASVITVLESPGLMTGATDEEWKTLAESVHSLLRLARITESIAVRLGQNVAMDADDLRGGYGQRAS
jgi:hypothetical protein